MKKLSRRYWLPITLVLQFGNIFLTQSEAAWLNIEPVPVQINAIRFDPSYYYNAPVKVDKLAEQLVEQWHAAGVNTIYFKVYDPEHGAKYRTRYLLNQMADYGRQDLLKYMLSASEKYNIQVLAWIPNLQHKAAWLAHPEWRVRTADAKDYQPNTDSYFLCPALPEVQQWAAGFIKDLLDHYPSLAGVDIAEPIVTWQTGHCYCDYCRHSNDSPAGLTKYLKTCIDLIHSHKKIACVTSVFSVHPDGRLYANGEQRLRSGFDLDGLRATGSFPDWLAAELIWQQWADLHANPVLFTAKWVQQATREVKARIGASTTLLVHIEVTPFGHQRVDAEALVEGIKNAKQAGVDNIDVYDTHQLDQNGMWAALQNGFSHQAPRQVLIISDSLGENDSKQLASLLSHFPSTISIHLLRDSGETTVNLLADQEVVLYVGVDRKFKIPHSLLVEMAGFDGKMVWINYGLDQFLAVKPDLLPGIPLITDQHDATCTKVFFKNRELQRSDPNFVRVQGLDTTRCQVHATMRAGKNILPYAIEYQRLWVFTDLLTAFVSEGDRHVVFADLVHDIMGQNHLTRHLALVRIEDVTPVSDVQSLRRIADYLADEDVPFSVAFVPFYLDPASHTAVSLSDQPEMIKTLKYVVQRGGLLVMHGSTHQFRDETTADYEFWDAMRQSPLQADGEEYVRERILSGLSEFTKNGLYPLLWETPHYGASQLDYGVINEYFSTAFERRQVIDLHGSDLLLPYLIQRHTSSAKIIPENMGYVPLEHQQAGGILQAASHYLLIRDGVASFFFHPFINQSVLKEIVTGMKKLGYEFTDPRTTTNVVRTPDIVIRSGSGPVSLNLKSHYLHQFLLGPQGEIRRETYSDSLLTKEFSAQVSVPHGWMFVAERMSQPRQSLVDRAVTAVSSLTPRLSTFTQVQKVQASPEAEPMQVLMAFDSTAVGQYAQDQKNIYAAFAVIGIDVQVIEVRKLLTVPEHINLICVPAAASRRLNEQQILFLVRALQSGKNLMLEKVSGLTTAIGLMESGESIPVKEVVDEYFPQVAISWRQADTLRNVTSDFDFVTYYSAKPGGEPVLIGGEYGDGKFLYLATFFDPDGEAGYGRFPYFFEVLKNQFSLAPAIRRDAVEIYFEPGSREEISIEDLIKIWRQNGVRKIYAAAWHTYPNYIYDYERLISLAHQNAMVVYAWLELPYVSDKFWLDHPQWREKTATGRDAKINGRRLMALEVPQCRQAVRDTLERLLTTFDWDGVNLADLYFDSPQGIAAPENFTPFHPESRRQFQMQYGFDPVQLVNPASNYLWTKNKKAVESFYTYRQDVVVQLHDELMQFLKQLDRRVGRHWELMITAVDPQYTPGIQQAIGLDLQRILELPSCQSATLQLQDPSSLGAIGSRHFAQLAAAKQKRHRTAPSMLEMVIMSYRDSHSHTAGTTQMTGLELATMIRAATHSHSRLALNSEASLYEVDLPLLPMVLAADCHEQLGETDWRVNCPGTVSLQLNGKAHRDILVDGVLWPAYYRGRVLLPKGDHTIEPLNRWKNFVDRFYSGTRLRDLSGELIAIRSHSLGLELEYADSTATYALLSAEPYKVEIDGRPYQALQQEGENGFSIRLPSGRHSASFYTEHRSTQIIKQASLILSGGIVLLGSVSGTIMLAMYFLHTRNRKPRR